MRIAPRVAGCGYDFVQRSVSALRERRGVSLVEMLVAIAVMTVVTTLGATMIALLMRSEGDGAKALARSTNLGRLAADFRRDVRAAADFEIHPADPDDPDRPAEMILTQDDDAAVVYRLQEEGVVRIERRGETDAGRETYRLPEGEKWFEAPDGGPVVVLVYARPAAVRSAGGGNIVHHEHRIEAAPAQDRRFAGGDDP